MSKSHKPKESRKHPTQIVVDDIVMNAASPEVITLRKVLLLDGYRVRMTFSNDEIRELNLEPYLRGPIFEPLRQDIQQFRRVSVHAETETLTWENGADMDPQTLYEDSIPVTDRPEPRTKLSNRSLTAKLKSKKAAAPAKPKTRTIKSNGATRSPKSRPVKSIRASARAK